MIRKLRKKFIIITMLSVFFVLSLILGTINVVNYREINKNADTVLKMITDNGGLFPKNDFFRHGGKPDMSPEIAYITRYFTCIFDSNGNGLMINTGSISAISSIQAEEYAKKALDSDKESFFIDDYKCKKSFVDEDIMIVFVDCSQNLSTFRSFLCASALVALIGFLAVFILILILSKIAIRPIAESYEKQKQFITDAGHEIKTPLTIIDANAEVLELEAAQENEWLKSIRNQVKRLSGLTENLIALSRMDEESVKLCINEFSLSEAVEEGISQFMSLAKANGKELSSNIEQGLFYKGDETMLRRLFSVLFENAIKYSNENGIINITLEKIGRQIKLSVFNTTDTIQKGELPMLFERFYRMDSSRSSRVFGYGLGLSAAKAITAAHKGKITAKSIDGKSLLITVIL